MATLATLRNWIPEFITATILSLAGIDISNPALIYLAFLLGTVLLRAIWNSAILIHGLGHVCITSIVDRDLSFIKANNILENRSLVSILKSLLPFNFIFLPLIHNTAYPWIAVGRINPRIIRVKALGGIFSNIIVLIITFNIDSINFDSYLADFDDTITIISQLLVQSFISANLYHVGLNAHNIEDNRIWT
jgi:hypothetical protein